MAISTSIANSTLYLRRRAANTAFIVLSISRRDLRPDLAGLHPGALREGRRRRPFADLVHRIHAAARIARAASSNAILGSVMMSVLAVVVGTPIGVCSRGPIWPNMAAIPAWLLSFASSTTFC